MLMEGGVIGRSGSAVELPDDETEIVDSRLSDWSIWLS